MSQTNEKIHIRRVQKKGSTFLVTIPTEIAKNIKIVEGNYLIFKEITNEIALIRKINYVISTQQSKKIVSATSDISKEEQETTATPPSKNKKVTITEHPPVDRKSTRLNSSH